MAEKILDIAHVSFLDMIRAMAAQAGAASTKGTLVRNATKAGEQVAQVDFPTFEDFVKAIDTADNPITKVEGKAVHLGHGVFGLPNCPFAPSIVNYKAVFGNMPPVFADVTNEFNKPGPVTEQMHVGHGAGVSPFCSVHQPMRSSVAGRITIGGKPITVFQLGCKSAAGKKAFAEQFIAEGGWSKDVVDKVLDTNMCCYGVKVAP